MYSAFSKYKSHVLIVLILIVFDIYALTKTICTFNTVPGINS